jgi:hypothetical protein
VFHTNKNHTGVLFHFIRQEVDHGALDVDVCHRMSKSASLRRLPARNRWRRWVAGLGRREDVAGGAAPAGSGDAWRSGGSGGACGAAGSGGACGGAVGAGADVEGAAKSGSLTASLGSRRRR